jgi:ribosome-binding factor A
MQHSRDSRDKGSNFKATKKSLMVTELAAQYIAREAGRTTLITPTRTDLGRDGKHATIFVSVFPTEEGEHAITFLMRHKDLFRTWLKTHARFPILPYIKFEIDYGELNRQRLDELSNEVGEIRPEEDPSPEEE